MVLQLLLDEQTTNLLSKGRIQIGHQQVLINVPETLGQLIDFTRRLLKSPAQNDVKITLKAYVDGLEPNEKIHERYMMTYEIDFKTANGLESESCIGFLINDMSKETKRMVGLPQHLLFEKQQPIKTTRMLRRQGQKRYQFVVLGDRGEIVKSNTAAYSVHPEVVEQDN